MHHFTTNYSGAHHPLRCLHGIINCKRQQVLRCSTAVGRAHTLKSWIHILLVAGHLAIFSLLKRALSDKFHNIANFIWHSSKMSCSTLSCCFQAIGLKFYSLRYEFKAFRCKEWSWPLRRGKVAVQWRSAVLPT